MVTLLNNLGLWHKKNDTSSSYYCILTDWNDVNQAFVLGIVIYLGVGSALACVLMCIDKDAIMRCKVMSFIVISTVWLLASAGLIGLLLHAEVSNRIADRSIG